MTASSSLKLDALLVTSLSNIFYLSGFTGSAALVLITQSDAVLITDGRYTVQSHAQCPDYLIEIADGSGGYAEALEHLLNGHGAISTIGYDDGDLTVRRLRELRANHKPAAVVHANEVTLASKLFGVHKKTTLPKSRNWKPAGGMVERLRFLKDETEIIAIRDSIKVAEDALDSLRNLLKPGIKERNFAIELEFMMRKLGADSPSFDTIVASGPNGALPHYHAGERDFEAGDLVTIDWGARVNGYCSDITRTVAIPGKPVDSKLTEIYNIVQTAKIKAVSACKSGKSGKAIDAIARGVITDAGYGKHFSHSLGHSLGIVTHDGQTLSQRAGSVKLAPGVITTVEPGIYIEDLGGVRIEEDVLVTENGPLVLTTADDEMM